MSEALFPGYEPELPPEVERLTDDRRRTLRQAAEVARGVHPLTRGPLHPEASREAVRGDAKGQPFTCGTCTHRIQRGYPKCDLSTMSRSAASDVRAWWPACVKYERDA